MSVEQKVTELTDAVRGLLKAVNMKMVTLHASVTLAERARDAAQASAEAARVDLADRADSVEQARSARDDAKGFLTRAAASATAAAQDRAAAAATVGPIADDIQTVGANITAIQDAAGNQTEIQTALLQMATAYTNAQTRYVDAFAFD